MDDEALVEGLLRGEFEAQLALLEPERYVGPMVEGLLRSFRKLGHGEIEDLVTEVLYDLIQKPTKIDLSKGRRGLLGDYIYQAAWNRAYDRHRKIFRSWLPKEDKADSQELHDQPRKVRQFFSLERNAGEIQTVDNQQVLQVEDTHPSLSEGTNIPVPYPPEVVQAARDMIHKLKLTHEQLEHIRMRLVDKLEPAGEIAPILGIKAGAENTRWCRLMKKVQTEWVTYPTLVEFGRQLSREEVLVIVANQTSK